MRSLRPLVLVTVALAPLRGAHAETWALEWVRENGAEACLDASALSSAVESRLGHRVFVAPSRAALTLEGVVRPIEGGFAASLVVRDAAGTRQGVRAHQVAGDCSALNDGLALIIALLIDPEAARAPLVSSPPTPVEAEVEAPPPPAPAPEAPPAPSASSTAFERSFELILEPTFGYGQLPQPSAGGKLTAWWVSRLGFPLSLSLRPWLGSSTTGAGPGVHEDLAGLEAAACPLGSARLKIWACATAEVGVLRAQGENVAVPVAAYYPLVDLGLAARALWPLTPRVALTASLGTALRLIRPQLVFRDADSVPRVITQVPLFTLEGGVGISIRMW